MKLYINTYGTYVHVKDDMFEVRVPKDGNYEKNHYAAKKVTGIVMPKGAALSTDAVFLAMKHNVDILFMENNGRMFGRIWHSKLGSTTKIRKAQLEASLNQTGVFWVKRWLAQKLDNQMNLLKDLKKNRAKQAAYIDEQVARIKALQTSVKESRGETVANVADTLRGLEGTAGRVYFETLSQLLPRVHQFGGRSFRPAKDPFNAFLNYTYGILYARVEKALMIAGLDPYLGFLHRDNYNQLSFVFDFIEPYRIFAEEPVFKLFSGKKVNQQHTDQIPNGYSLNQEGKALLLEHFNKFFEENKIVYKNRKHTRNNIIQYDAHEFANSLIKPAPETTTQ